MVVHPALHQLAVLLLRLQLRRAAGARALPDAPGAGRGFRSWVRQPARARRQRLAGRAALRARRRHRRSRLLVERVRGDRAFDRQDARARRRRGCLMGELGGRVSLDGPWEFQLDPAGDLTPAGLGPMRRVKVPGPWQAEHADLHLASGVGWYRRSFDVPADWRTARVLLRFGAVDYYAEVWLNGQRIGDHEGGYLPFAFEIQDRIVHDRLNELIVRVVDPGMDTADAFPQFRFFEIPHGKQSWYGPVGGIWQSVTLERRGRTYVQSLRLTPDVAAERVRVTCEVAYPESGRLVILIQDPN